MNSPEINPAATGPELLKMQLLLDRGADANLVPEFTPIAIQRAVSSETDISASLSTPSAE